MKKRLLAIVLMFLVVASLISAQEEENSKTFPQESSEQSDRIQAPNSNKDCGFFCKVSEWWNGFRGEESVAGKAGELPEAPAVQPPPAEAPPTETAYTRENPYTGISQLTGSKFYIDKLGNLRAKSITSGDDAQSAILHYDTEKKEWVSDMAEQYSQKIIDQLKKVFPKQIAALQSAPPLPLQDEIQDKVLVNAFGPDQDVLIYMSVDSNNAHTYWYADGTRVTPRSLKEQGVKARNKKGEMKDLAYKDLSVIVSETDLAARAIKLREEKGWIPEPPTPEVPSADEVDAASRAEVLIEAMEGWGTNEEDLLSALEAVQTPRELELLQQKYKEQTGRELEAALRDELGDEDYAKYTAVVEKFKVKEVVLVSAETPAPAEVPAAEAAQAAPADTLPPAEKSSADVVDLTSDHQIINYDLEKEKVVIAGGAYKGEYYYDEEDKTWREDGFLFYNPVAAPELQNKLTSALAKGLATKRKLERVAAQPLLSTPAPKEETAAPSSPTKAQPVSISYTDVDEKTKTLEFYTDRLGRVKMKQADGSSRLITRGETGGGEFFGIEGSLATLPDDLVTQLKQQFPSISTPKEVKPLLDDGRALVSSLGPEKDLPVYTDKKGTLSYEDGTLVTGKNLPEGVAQYSDLFELAKKRDETRGKTPISLATDTGNLQYKTPPEPKPPLTTVTAIPQSEVYRILTEGNSYDRTITVVDGKTYFVNNDGSLTIAPEIDVKNLQKIGEFNNGKYYSLNDDLGLYSKQTVEALLALSPVTEGTPFTVNQNNFYTDGKEIKVSDDWLDSTVTINKEGKIVLRGLIASDDETELSESELNLLGQRLPKEVQKLREERDSVLKGLAIQRREDELDKLGIEKLEGSIINPTTPLHQHLYQGDEAKDFQEYSRVTGTSDLEGWQKYRNEFTTDKGQGILQEALHQQGVRNIEIAAEQATVEGVSSGQFTVTADGKTFTLTLEEVQNLATDKAAAQTVLSKYQSAGGIAPPEAAAPAEAPAPEERAGEEAPRAVAEVIGIPVQINPASHLGSIGQQIKERSMTAEDFEFYVDQLGQYHAVPKGESLPAGVTPYYPRANELNYNPIGAPDTYFTRDVQPVSTSEPPPVEPPKTYYWIDEGGDQKSGNYEELVRSGSVLTTSGGGELQDVAPAAYALRALRSSIEKGDLAPDDDLNQDEVAYLVQHLEKALGKAKAAEYIDEGITDTDSKTVGEVITALQQRAKEEAAYGSGWQYQKQGVYQDNAERPYAIARVESMENKALQKTTAENRARAAAAEALGLKEVPQSFVRVVENEDGSVTALFMVDIARLEKEQKSKISRITVALPGNVPDEKAFFSSVTSYDTENEVATISEGENAGKYYFEDGKWKKTIDWGFDEDASAEVAASLQTAVDKAAGEGKKPTVAEKVEAGIAAQPRPDVSGPTSFPYTKEQEVVAQALVNRKLPLEVLQKIASAPAREGPPQEFTDNTGKVYRVSVNYDVKRAANRALEGGTIAAKEVTYSGQQGTLAITDEGGFQFIPKAGGNAVNVAYESVTIEESGEEPKASTDIPAPTLPAQPATEPAAAPEAEEEPAAQAEVIDIPPAQPPEPAAAEPPAPEAPPAQPPPAKIVKVLQQQVAGLKKTLDEKQGLVDAQQTKVDQAENAAQALLSPGESISSVADIDALITSTEGDPVFNTNSRLQEKAAALKTYKASLNDFAPILQARDEAQRTHQQKVQQLTAARREAAKKPESKPAAPEAVPAEEAEAPKPEAAPPVEAQSAERLNAISREAVSLLAEKRGIDAQMPQALVEANAARKEYEKANSGLLGMDSWYKDDEEEALERKALELEKKRDQLMGRLAEIERRAGEILTEREELLRPAQKDAATPAATAIQPPTPITFTSRFKDDLLRELQQKGIDTSNVNSEAEFELKIKNYQQLQWSADTRNLPGNCPANVCTGKASKLTLESIRSDPLPLVTTKGYVQVGKFEGVAVYADALGNLHEHFAGGQFVTAEPSRARQAKESGNYVSAKDLSSSLAPPEAQVELYGKDVDRLEYEYREETSENDNFLVQAADFLWVFDDDEEAAAKVALEERKEQLLEKKENLFDVEHPTLTDGQKKALKDYHPERLEAERVNTIIESDGSVKVIDTRLPYHTIIDTDGKEHIEFIRAGATISQDFSNLEGDLTAPKNARVVSQLYQSNAITLSQYQQLLADEADMEDVGEVVEGNRQLVQTLQNERINREQWYSRLTEDEREQLSADEAVSEAEFTALTNTFAPVLAGAPIEGAPAAVTAEPAPPVGTAPEPVGEPALEPIPPFITPFREGGSLDIKDATFNLPEGTNVVGRGKEGEFNVYALSNGDEILAKPSDGLLYHISNEGKWTIYSSSSGELEKIDRGEDEGKPPVTSDGSLAPVLQAAVQKAASLYPEPTLAEIPLPPAKEKPTAPSPEKAVADFLASADAYGYIENLANDQVTAEKALATLEEKLEAAENDPTRSGEIQGFKDQIKAAEDEIEKYEDAMEAIEKSERFSDGDRGDIAKRMQANLQAKQGLAAAASKAVSDAREKLNELNKDQVERLLEDKEITEADLAGIRAALGLAAEDPSVTVENAKQKLNEQKGKIEAKEAEIKTLEERKKAADKALAEEQIKQKAMADAVGRMWTLSGAQTALFLNNWLTQTPRFPALSNAIFGNEDWFKTWKSDREADFAPLYLEQYFESLICEQAFDREPTPGTAAIRTGPDTYQFVGAIQAERSPQPQTPLNCPCRNGECRDGLCYDDEFDTTPQLGYFYKITWAVTAPQDISFTLLRDEGRQEIDFNLKVDHKFIFKDPVTGIGNENTNHLGMGNSSKQLPLSPVIVDVSPNDPPYHKACIVFGTNKPRSRGVGFAESIVNDICLPITDSKRGELNFQAGITSSGASPQGTSRAGTYCGIDGC